MRVHFDHISISGLLCDSNNNILPPDFIVISKFLIQPINRKGHEINFVIFFNFEGTPEKVTYY